MKVSVVNTGFFKLDGGAMFGVVPKRMWEKLNPPDEKNLCSWAMRTLLVETDNRKILIDTGMGNKQGEKFRYMFEPYGDDNLLESLDNQMLRADDITDVFLTHLHFDHCGGALMRNTEGGIVPTFPKADYWTNKAHFDWATHPNPRESASFLTENIAPLAQHSVLKYVEISPETPFAEGFDVQFAYGHTEAMMLPHLQIGKKRLVFCADLLPSSLHIPMPYVMSYDIRPLETLKEKAKLLEAAADNGWILFFEHDPLVEVGTVKRDERGRIVLDKAGALTDFLV